jgi:hypothetical protein
LNFAVGQTIPNAVVSKVGSGGQICLFSSAATHLIVDAAGYFPGATAPNPWTLYYSGEYYSNQSGETMTSNDGHRSIVGFMSGVVKILDPRDGSQVVTTPAALSVAYPYAISPDGKEALVIVEGGVYKRWVLTTGETSTIGGICDLRLFSAWNDLVAIRLPTTDNVSPATFCVLATNTVITPTAVVGDAVTLARNGRYAAYPTVTPNTFEVQDLRTGTIVSRFTSAAWRLASGRATTGVSNKGDVLILGGTQPFLAILPVGAADASQRVVLPGLIRGGSISEDGTIAVGFTGGGDPFGEFRVPTDVAVASATSLLPVGIGPSSNCAFTAAQSSGTSIVLTSGWGCG